MVQVGSCLLVFPTRFPRYTSSSADMNSVRTQRDQGETSTWEIETNRMLIGQSEIVLAVLAEQTSLPSERLGQEWPGRRRSLFPRRHLEDRLAVSWTIVAIVAASDALIRSLGSGTSRPQTPPTRGSATPPASRVGSNTVPPVRKTYTEFLTHTNSDWGVEADDDNDEEQSGNGEEDEDEFGLPSMSSIRVRGKRPSAGVKGSGGRAGSGLGRYRNGAASFVTSSGRPRSDSTDIAEERGAPSYPLPKKSEGKILRPQYKDILRGRSNGLAGSEANPVQTRPILST